jgi:hypothetical protein
MAGRIDDDFMTAEHDGRVIATARYSSQRGLDQHRSSFQRVLTERAQEHQTG